MSKTINFVYGCDSFGEGNYCQYCYVKAKFSNKMDFHHPKYYPEKLIEKLSQKIPDIFVGSIMGDFLSHSITDDNLSHIFSTIEEHPQHLVMLLSKNPDRYVEFRDNVWKRNLPNNILYGTSMENERFRHRLDPLKELQSSGNRIWLEIEPILGFFDNVDFSGLSYVSCSSLGEDQIYRDKAGRKFSSLFDENWMLSIIENKTLDINILSIYSNIRNKSKSPKILSHENASVWRYLRENESKENDEIGLW